MSQQRGYHGGGTVPYGPPPSPRMQQQPQQGPSAYPPTSYHHHHRQQQPQSPRKLNPQSAAFSFLQPDSVPATAGSGSFVPPPPTTSSLAYTNAQFAPAAAGSSATYMAQYSTHQESVPYPPPPPPPWMHHQATSPSTSTSGPRAPVPHYYGPSNGVPMYMSPPHRAMPHPHSSLLPPFEQQQQQHSQYGGAGTRPGQSPHMQPPPTLPPQASPTAMFPPMFATSAAPAQHRHHAAPSPIFSRPSDFYPHRARRRPRPPPVDQAPPLSVGPNVRPPPEYRDRFVLAVGTSSGPDDHSASDSGPAVSSADSVPLLSTAQGSTDQPSALPAAPLLLSATPTPRDLSSVSTTATVASSSQSSPVLTPASPATTTTTIDDHATSQASSSAPAVTAATTAASTPMTPKSPASTAASTPAAMKRSWADLLRSPSGSAPSSPLVNGSSPSVTAQAQSSSSRQPATASSLATSSIAGPSKRTLAHTLQGVENQFANANIVPRGLINNGNLCFANAILQVLVYCSPFWNLMALIRRETRQDLAGKTPTMDAMMSFLDEFRSSSKVSIVSRHRTKSSGPGSSGSHQTPAPPPLDTFMPTPQSDWADPFVPEAVYESLKPNKRFEPMTKGHQEDAEEFLGFFLDTLHDEILFTIDKADRDAEDGPDGANKDGADDEWMEVGSKGRTATTRTTETRESPITRIFGGQLRSVLRCPGQKDSITLEPYQRLQLDISPDRVRTIEDALLNLTQPEPLPDFVSRSGLRVEATKQVFLETLPPVLILHLKRFLYDNVGGVQKSGKVVGYGTELDVHDDVIGPAKRTGTPVRYQLFGVVYHHGMHATGGHYTVAVRQQLNSNSWLHIDDTHIRPISPADVAVGREGAHGSDNEKSAYLLLYSRMS